MPGARQLGDPVRPAVGRAARRLAARRLRRPGRAARGASTRRRTSSCGSRTPATTPPPAGTTARLRRALRHLAVVAGGAGRRRHRLRVDQPAPHRRRLRASSSTGRTTSSSPSLPPSRSGRAPVPARSARSTPLVVRDDVRQETVGPVGAEDPATIVLRQQRGLRRARQVDTVVAAVVGACDGELPLGAILDAVAQLLELDPAATRERYLPRDRRAGGRGISRSPVGQTGRRDSSRLVPRPRWSAPDLSVLGRHLLEPGDDRRPVRTPAGPARRGAAAAAPADPATVGVDPGHRPSRLRRRHAAAGATASRPSTRAAATRSSSRTAAVPAGPGRRQLPRPGARHRSWSSGPCCCWSA